MLSVVITGQQLRELNERGRGCVEVPLLRLTAVSGRSTQPACSRAQHRVIVRRSPRHHGYQVEIAPPPASSGYSLP